MAHILIGIDEVGRGPLAGPVVVAAFAITAHGIANTQLRIMNGKRTKTVPLKDSKKLSKLQRELWFEELKKGKRGIWTIARVNPRRIDRINISRAANFAATNALRRLMEQLGVSRARVVLDGGLYLREPFLTARGISVRAATVIRADEKFPCVQLASIVAKVSRDRYMVRKHKEFPQYGFAEHKGYGTRAHIKALKKHGPSPLHRRSFRPLFYDNSRTARRRDEARPVRGRRNKQ